ncbi:alpha/beta hydrolase domain-containing protein 17B-like [Brachionichthys hirsutus]|uniref:alpha/beta hydrolase domain-containing protein 17B-like n=1 Tax=Brachionichthys hirsutus TaxID=412623 RepID=UPI00360514A4
MVLMEQEVDSQEENEGGWDLCRDTKLTKDAKCGCWKYKYPVHDRQEHHIQIFLYPPRRYGIRPENVIVYGQSIGTVPSVDLASRYESAAVVLHSPLTSGMRVAFPDTKKTFCFDAFPNIDKISKVTSPVLVIHGTEDEVIDFSHGLALYERCQRPVEPLWVEGAGHNDVELYGQYLERLKQFVAHELANL